MKKLFYCILILLPSIALAQITIDYSSGTWSASPMSTSNDLADMVVTSASASGAITADVYSNALANATIADAGLTTGYTVDNTNKRVTYTGSPTITVMVVASISATSTKSNEEVRFRLAKTGATDADTEIVRKIGTGSDVGAMSVQGLFSLDTNDYIELFVTLDTSTSDTVTVEKCNLSIITIN